MSDPINFKDNITPSTDELALDASKIKAPVQTTGPIPNIPDFFNITQALQFISEYYGRTFKTLNFSPPSQITDGCVVEFIDPAMNVTVASARLRARNSILLNKETGDMMMQCQLTDIAFLRPSVPITMNASGNK